LQPTGRDEHSETGRGAADGGRASEADQADEERALTPEQIRQSATEKEEAAERERIRGDDPLTVAVGESERVLSGRQGNVHDRSVEHDHHLGQPQDDEYEPSPRVGGFRGSTRHGRVDVDDHEGLQRCEWRCAVWLSRMKCVCERNFTRAPSGPSPFPEWAARDYAVE